MSHLRRCTVKISQPHRAVLEGAMEILAQQLDGSVQTSIKDYYGRNVPVDFGFVAPGVRGFGVNVKDGGLEVLGDDYGQRIRLDGFQGMLSKAYKQYAILLALKKMGYNTQIHEIDQGLAILGMKP